MLRDSILLRLRPRHLARYRRIAEVLARHGFGAVLAQLGLADRFNIPRRLLRRGVEESDRVPPAVRLRLALEELGPTFIKLGQIASTRPEILPPAVLAELNNLQDKVPPDPWEAILPLIEAELGRPLAEVFAAFDPTPIASASLAQVYPALLPDGTHVVVKVQRPGVERLIDTDLHILSDIAHLVRERLPGFVPFDPVEMAEEFANALREELDYRREGRNADRFRENFEAEEYVYVPRVYWQYTTRRLMVQERLRGIKIDDLAALDAAGLDRHRIAMHASRLIIREVLEDGFFHADPHPGNLFIEPDGTIGLVDFGMVGTLSAPVQAQLVAMVVAFASRDAVQLSEALLAFAPPRGNVDRIRLNREVDRLVRAYTEKPLAEVDMVEIIDGLLDIARGYHLRPPTEISLIGRMLALLDGIGRALDPGYSMVAVLKPYVETMMRRRFQPDAVWAGLVSLLSETVDLGAHAPRRLLRILTRYEQEGVKVAVDAETIEPYMRRVELLGDRVLAGFLLGSAINAVGNLGSTDNRFLVKLRVPLLIAGTGMVTALSTYLLRTSHHRR